MPARYLERPPNQFDLKPIHFIENEMLGPRALAYEPHPFFAIKPFKSLTHIAAIYAALGNKDKALAWLTKACDDYEQGVVDLKVDPRLDTLRADPRFVVLLRRVKLAT